MGASRLNACDKNENTEFIAPITGVYLLGSENVNSFSLQTTFLQLGKIPDLVNTVCLYFVV